MTFCLFRFWLLAFIFYEIVTYLVAYGTSYIFDTSISNPIVHQYGVWEMLFLGVFVAPILETFIYFFLPFTVFRYFFRKYRLKGMFFVFLFITATLFALSHPYGPRYLITTLVAGLVMAVIYHTAYRKRFFPFFGIVILHACANLVVWVVNF